MLDLDMRIKSEIWPDRQNNGTHSRYAMATVLGMINT